MFNQTPSEPTGIEKAIDELLTQLDDLTADSEEYAQMVDQLVKLHEMKTTESPRRVSPDTLATIGAHLLGIIVIVGYEQKHILTSKAIGFVQKLTS